MILGIAAALLASRSLRSFALTILRGPFTMFVAGVRVAGLLPRVPGLAAENAALRRELAAKQLEVSAVREAARHLDRLDALTTATVDRPAVVVSVIGRSLAPGEHLITLDKGARDGMLPDAILLDADGLVGRVIEVHPTTSIAMLLTDPNSRVACLIERSRELGLLVGTGASLERLIHLDLESDIAVDDHVVTAGLGGPFPKGLVIGTIVRIERDEQAGTASAWVRPAVTLRQLEELLCVLPVS